MACFRIPFTYEAVMQITHGDGKALLQDLISRGLVQRISRNKSFELHPIVRCYYNMKLSQEEVGNIRQQLQIFLTIKDSDSLIDVAKFTGESVQIFLAHAKEEKGKILELYAQLNEKGYRTWLDQENILPGQNWQKEIKKAIEKSHFFVDCLSKKACDRGGYLHQELRMALREYANRPPGTIYLIPLKLEECDVPQLEISNLGVGLRDIQWLDYWKKDGLNKLLRAIKYQF